jgi:predicted nicotinamide N-methyase
VDDDLIEESIGLHGAALQVLRPRDTEALLDEHAFEHEEFLPYWAELWPSGVALARRVASRSLRGARVLELGCGLGLPSLAAALAGGRVLATDWSPQAIALLEENAERNDAELETALVDWARPDAIVARAPWDLVLAADVLYERRNVAPLLDLLPRLGAEVWIADPGRAPAEALLEGLGEGWTRHDEADGRVTVHRLMRTAVPSAAE